MNKLNNKRVLGQGMTEYIIIVALIAVAAITAYSFFGQSMRTQLGGIASELSGKDGTTAITASQTQADTVVTDGATAKKMGTYTNAQ